MINKLFFSLVSTALFSMTGMTAFAQERATLLPENDYHIAVRSAEANDVTEDQFNQILAFFGPQYEAAFAKRNLKFQVVGRWSDGTVNAYAEQRGGTAYVTIFGGIARHKYITIDALAAVVCHEIGHHLGGAPKVRGWGGNNWASNDGQSDYYATLKCLRTYFKAFKPTDNMTIVNRIYKRRGFMADPLAVTECQKAYKEAPDQAICIRSTAAGISLATTLADLSNASKMPQLSTRDTKVVSTTDDRHPAAQCRLDTYFSGALCPISENEDLDDKNPSIGACTGVNGAPELYHRPRCWYKPTESGLRNRFMTQM